MRPTNSLLVAAVASAAIGCANADVNAPGAKLPGSYNGAHAVSARSSWGSDSASLTVTADSANLRLLSSGGCVASYVDAANPFTSVAFVGTGVYTELIGAYPGKLTYPAQITGSRRGAVLTLTVTVPARSLVIGPLDLTRGVAHSWPNCLFP